VIVYDLTNQYSFDRVLTWVEAVDNANSTAAEPIPKLLVGNKVDLDHLRQVSFKAGNEMAKRINAVFVETSAKDSLNVDLAFLNLARKLVLGK
jgi:GTPase SAR1 family protein